MRILIWFYFNDREKETIFDIALKKTKSLQTTSIPLVLDRITTLPDYFEINKPYIYKLKVIYQKCELDRNLFDDLLKISFNQIETLKNLAAISDEQRELMKPIKSGIIERTLDNLVNYLWQENNCKTIIDMAFDLTVRFIKNHPLIRR